MLVTHPKIVGERVPNCKSRFYHNYAVCYQPGSRLGFRYRSLSLDSCSRPETINLITRFSSLKMNYLPWKEEKVKLKKE